MIEDAVIEANFDPDMAEYQALRDGGLSHTDACIVMSLGPGNLKQARAEVVEAARDWAETRSRAQCRTPQARTLKLSVECLELLERLR